MKYRKKPVVVEAMQYDGTQTNEDKIIEWAKASTGDRTIIVGDFLGRLKIATLEGVMIANKGDYIIKGIKGELYPCKPDIFEETYEEVK